MSDDPLFAAPSSWVQGLLDLQRDLLDPGGPRISTMRNQRLALCLYPMAEEFALRRRVHDLSQALLRAGWIVRDLSLQHAVQTRLAARPAEARAALEARERRLVVRDAPRALQYLCDQVTPVLEGVDGVARVVAGEIQSLVDAHPQQQDRTVVFLSRVWALYPFVRVSALLKHLAGKTHHVSVVVLYPGTRQGEGLSLLGQLDADRDYRPRIYP